MSGIPKIFAEARWLDSSQNVGYGTLPIPCPQDERISELLCKWRDMDAGLREGKKAELTDSQKLTLSAYSERIVTLAVRQKNVNILVLGLISLGLGVSRSDQRNELPILSLYHDAALRIGSSPASVFKDAAAILGENVFGAFLSRNEADKSIDAMGYQAHFDDSGFRYVRTW